MKSRVTDGKRWTQVDLESLTVERGFRLRGTEVTRLDTFLDAAFAFVLTLLVISLDEIPSSYAEMLAAVRRVPAFAASFAILMLFWLAHRSWSRRYGLENPRTILLSLALIFVVLVYVYPLRAILEAMFFQLSGGYLPSSFGFATYDELRGILAFYSVGFFAMSLIFAQLYRAPLRCSTLLALNDFETRKTRNNMIEWALAAIVSLLSILLGLIVPDTWVPIAGYIYFALFVVMPLPTILSRQRITAD